METEGQKEKMMCWERRCFHVPGSGLWPADHLWEQAPGEGAQDPREAGTLVLPLQEWKHQELSATPPQACVHGTSCKKSALLHSEDDSCGIGKNILEQSKGQRYIFKSKP